MPDIITLSAEPRARAGKGAARAMRRLGRVPGIIYGDNREPVLISLEPRALSRVLANRGFFATLIDVDVGGVMHRTLPRDVQRHPATDVPLHVDFMRVGADTQVRVTVPVVFVNPEMSPGLRRGARAEPPPADGDAPSRRHPQYCPSRHRAELPGRRHPRPAGG